MALTLCSQCSSDIAPDMSVWQDIAPSVISVTWHVSTCVINHKYIHKNVTHWQLETCLYTLLLSETQCRSVKTCLVWRVSPRFLSYCQYLNAKYCCRPGLKRDPLTYHCNSMSCLLCCQLGALETFKISEKRENLKHHTIWLSLPEPI